MGAAVARRQAASGAQAPGDSRGCQALSGCDRGPGAGADPWRSASEQHHRWPAAPDDLAAAHGPTAGTLEAIGQDALAGQLDRLTHNEDIYVPGAADTRLKLRHSNKDGAAFEEVMDAEVPVDHETLSHAASRVVRAHEYFTAVVTEWLDSGTDGSAERAQALTSVLTRGLQLVAINLTVNENSQEIFETLNARGTPLTAADLIRNFVFQRLAAEGANTRVHLDNWPFETEFWEKDVSVAATRCSEAPCSSTSGWARGSGRKSALARRSRGSSSTSNRSSSRTGRTSQTSSPSSASRQRSTRPGRRRPMLATNSSAELSSLSTG